MRKLLWADCIAAGAAGVLMLMLSGWLSTLTLLPRRLLLVMGAVNLVYAAYSFTLAMRARRPRALIYLLVFGNFAWTGVCMTLAARFAGSASVFGMAHLVGEALFVAGLASLEWRWRELLLTAG